MIKVCGVCGHVFNHPKSSNNKANIRSHLRINPTHYITVIKDQQTS